MIAPGLPIGGDSSGGCAGRGPFHRGSRERALAAPQCPLAHAPGRSMHRRLPPGAVSAATEPVPQTPERG